MLHNVIESWSFAIPPNVNRIPNCRPNSIVTSQVSADFDCWHKLPNFQHLAINFCKVNFPILSDQFKTWKEPILGSKKKVNVATNFGLNDTEVSHLLRFLASLYRMTPITVSVYPNMPVTDTGFRNIKREITTATAPFAFPRTWNVCLHVNQCTISLIRRHNSWFWMWTKYQPSYYLTYNLIKQTSSIIIFVHYLS